MPLLLSGPWRWALAAVVLMLGAWVQLQQPTVMPAAWAGLLAGAGLALALGSFVRVAGRFNGGENAAHPLRPVWLTTTCLVVGLLSLALLNFALTSLRAHARLSDSLPAVLEGQDLLLTGTVVGLPRVGPNGTHFELEVESAQLGGQAVQVPSLVRLSWITGWDGESLLASPPAPLLAGDRWQMVARLARPHGVLNPQGFDLELWMFERGLGASGSVRPGARMLGPGSLHPIDRMRQTARDAVLRRVADERVAGVLAALAVGDQAAIHRDDWDVFRITGVAHLLSISGMHVTMFAWLAAWAIRRLWSLSSRAALAVPAPDAARWGGLLLAVLYALVSGWGVPAQRTVVMLGVIALLRSAGHRWPWPLIWLAAGTAVVLWDPWALLQPGFWLSFVAVGVLMASEPAGRDQARQGLWAHALAGLRTQAVATVALAPLSMVFFQQVSVVGGLANLLAVPWVTLVVTPLALLGLVLPPLWSLGALAVEALMQVLALFAAWPLAQWSAAAAPMWAVLLGLLGGFLLVLPLPWRLRLLGLPLMLPLLAPTPPRPTWGEVHVVAADIGQGTAVLVRTREHLLVYDAGPRYSPESDAAGRVLLPLLRARAERHVDRLVLSHRDIDHTGGAETLLAGVPVRSAWSSLEAGHPLLPLLPEHQRCHRGQQWSWDGVQFEVLHPELADYDKKLKTNAMSCVIRVSDARGARLLLTGDIEAPQEAELLARAGAADLAAPLLMLPHHGSRTSSTAEFLAAVKPRVAVAQAAHRSRFGHPAQEVTARVQAQGAVLVRSDRCGAWQWPSDSAEAEPAAWPIAWPIGLDREIPAQSAAVEDDPGVCERERRRRYWHHPGRP